MIKLEVSRSFLGRNNTEQYQNMRKYLNRIGYRALATYFTWPAYTVYAKKIGDQDGNAG